MIAFSLCLLLFQETEDPIQIVKEGFLPDLSDFAHVGLVVDNYRHFVKRDWHSRKDGAFHIVTVVGEIDDKAATDHFHAKNKYALKNSLKAMQLTSYYELTKDKKALRFTFNFRVGPGRQFKLQSGSLGVQSASNDAWREKALEDRALLALLTGVYRNRNPYQAMIDGMPYK